MYKVAAWIEKEPKQIPILVLIKPTEYNSWPFYGDGLSVIDRPDIKNFVQNPEDRKNVIELHLKTCKKYLRQYEEACEKLRSDIKELEAVLK